MGGGGGGAFSGNNGNGAVHTRAPSTGNEDFSDFQGSSSAPGGGGGGETTSAPGGGTGATTNGAVTNPKWRDVSSLVDLGGLSSNTDKKVRALFLLEWGGWPHWILYVGGTLSPLLHVLCPPRLCFLFC